MGLLDALMPPDYRDVAMAIKKYAVSTALSDRERSTLNNLRIGEDVFVREKILFMCAFIRACLVLRENQGDRPTASVRHYFDVYTEEYFKTLPGIASSAGMKEYDEAQNRYGTFNKDRMYPGFLERVKQDPAERDPMKAFDKAWVAPQEFGAFVSLMDHYCKSIVEFLTKQLTRLKS
jgi:hypothetical protein